MADGTGELIPDISGQAAPSYKVRARPAFAPPQDMPQGLPVLALWSRQAAPELIFGAPAGWIERPAVSATFFPIELAHVSREAQIMSSTRILAVIERAESALSWSVQLRRYAAALAPVVMQNPIGWAKAKSSWAEFIGPPVYRSIANSPAIVLRYAFEVDGVVYVLYETWLAYDGGGYHFMGIGPAADEDRVWPEWESILQSTRTESSAPIRPTTSQVVPAAEPGAQYRCGVQVQVPVTLENVANEQRSLFIVAAPSTAAWAAFAAVAMRLYGNAKASGLEGRTVAVPAEGEAILMDDRVVIRAVINARAGGVRLRGDMNSRTIDLEIPYRVVRSFGTDSRGVWLDVVGRGAVWLQPQDRGEFGQWLAHLSYNRTWQPPQQLALERGAIAGWCQQDPRYTFGLPSGWGQPPAAALADYARLFQPSVVRCAVLLDAGQWEAQVFVIEDGPWAGLGDGDALAASILSATNISPVGAAQVTNVGGEAVACVRGTSWSTSGQEERCYGALVHGGIRFFLWYGTVGGAVGDGSYERYLADFHTMLATWHWYR